MFVQITKIVEGPTVYYRPGQRVDIADNVFAQQLVDAGSAMQVTRFSQSVEDSIADKLLVRAEHNPFVPANPLDFQ
jgi:hypothetical protein